MDICLLLVLRCECPSVLLPELLIMLPLINQSRLCWTQAHSNLQQHLAALSSCPARQHQAPSAVWPLDLNRRFQLPSVAPRVSPREVQFQKPSLDLHPAQSNWWNTGLRSPHTTCGRLGKNDSLETEWYKSHENKWSGWQHTYLQTNHKSTFEYFE